MKTNILRMAPRNVLQSISQDFGVNVKDFETLKYFHEEEFEGLSFRQAKKTIIVDVFTDKKQVEKYLEDNIKDCNESGEYLGEDFVKEIIQTIQFLKSYLKTMSTDTIKEVCREHDEYLNALYLFNNKEVELDKISSFLDVSINEYRESVETNSSIDNGRVNVEFEFVKKEDPLYNSIVQVTDIFEL